MRWLRTIPLALSYVFYMIMAALSSGSSPRPPFQASNTEISDQCFTSITPAGYTFSVWGLIYLFLTLYVIWQSLPAQDEHPLLDRLAFYQTLGCLSGGFWLIVFSHRLFWPAELLIVLYLLTLLYAYYYMGVGLAKVSWKEKWFCHVPISLNVSWVLVANLASLTLTLQCGGGWKAPADWSVAWLMFAGLVGVVIALTRADIAWIVVAVWAAIGIANNHVNPVREMAIAVALILPVFLLLGLVEQYYNPVYDRFTGYRQAATFLLAYVKRDARSAHQYRTRTGVVVPNASAGPEEAYGGITEDSPAPAKRPFRN
eukprot:gb/GEZN01010197.1/.p1 GENE.gb/GEZN01010197.1/~~gb/GEZN01010197.1/.p1  ORF type:complete len:323 (+),score=42.46 gb/GEZN01010197.1/:30-971(+)